MYRSPDGESYFTVDGRIHNWDASPENQTNQYGEGFVKCFYDYHRNLSPEEWVWPLEKFQRYGDEALMHDLFDVGYADVAIFQPTYLTDFYKNGFNTTAQDAPLKEKHLDKFTLNGSFDARGGEHGLPEFEETVKKYNRKAALLFANPEDAAERLSFDLQRAKQ